MDPNLVSQVQPGAGMPTGVPGQVGEGNDHFQHQQQPQQQQQQQQQPHHDAGKAFFDTSQIRQKNNVFHPEMTGYGVPMGNLWQTNFDTAMQEGESPSDSWSTGSGTGQAIPTALNVEDW